MDVPVDFLRFDPAREAEALALGAVVELEEEEDARMGGGARFRREEEAAEAGVSWGAAGEASLMEEGAGVA